MVSTRGDSGKGAQITANAAGPGHQHEQMRRVSCADGSSRSGPRTYSSSHTGHCTPTGEPSVVENTDRMGTVPWRPSPPPRARSSSCPLFPTRTVWKPPCDPMIVSGLGEAENIHALVRLRAIDRSFEKVNQR